MNLSIRNFIKLLLLAQSFSILGLSQDFDFFYFIQTWPGAYCDMKRSCCYPTSGKPKSDFGIHGFWPNFNNGSYPSNCDLDSGFDKGIKPNDEMHELERIRGAVKSATRFAPGIQCNIDASRIWQLFGISLCVDTYASEFIECPVSPKYKCESQVQFPKF